MERVLGAGRVASLIGGPGWWWSKRPRGVLLDFSVELLA